jgi:predicted nuclease with TOPRIM domain
MRGLEDELSDYQSSNSKSIESPKFIQKKKKHLSPPMTSTKDRVKRMSDQASQLTKTLRVMMDRFSNFETKLKELSSEHQKQRTINDHLLS